MELHFEVRGQGEPLIILHGLFGCLDNWHSISLKLSDRFRVFSVDQRNHGRTPHSHEMNYQVMAADVIELIRSQGLIHASVLGHSMGGKTAMQLALSYPAFVNRLIVADIAPRRYSPRHQRAIAGMLALDLTRFASRKEIEAALAPAVPDLATRQVLLKNIVRADGGAFYWRLGLKQIQDNYFALTEALQADQPFAGPTLFIRGEGSDYLSEADLPEILLLFPRARLETIPGTDHLLHVQRPEQFVKLVCEFLAID